VPFVVRGSLILRAWERSPDSIPDSEFADHEVPALQLAHAHLLKAAEIVQRRAIVGSQGERLPHSVHRVGQTA